MPLHPMYGMASLVLANYGEIAAVEPIYELFLQKSQELGLHATIIAGVY